MKIGHHNQTDPLPGLSIGEDHGFADKLSLGLLKRTEDG
jgi:hypothetical protein